MHDGHVTVDSVLNQGTTVSVFLPAHETAAAP
jgi:signal transduction histidine kinase